MRLAQGYTRRMSETAEQLLKKALSLNEQDRASLAGALIESLHPDLEPGVDEAWDAEIARRVKELESRTVETVPWSTVRERLFRGYE
jgi:putative addiction module component (TIGR02574 family)